MTVAWVEVEVDETLENLLLRLKLLRPYCSFDQLEVKLKGNISPAFSALFETKTFGKIQEYSSLELSYF
jgi:hypothetical protein